MGRSTFRRILQYTQRYWVALLFGVFGIVTLSAADAGFTWLIKPIVDDGLVNRSVAFVAWIPIVILVLFAVRGVASFVSTYFVSRVARFIVMDFRQDLFKKFLTLPSQFYHQNNSGKLISTLIYNVQQISEASANTFLVLLREVSFLVALLVVMFTISWRLSLLFFAVGPFIYGVIRWSSKRMRRLSSEVQQLVGRVTHVADESIKGYQVVRLHHNQANELDKFCRVTEDNRHQELKVIVTRSLSTVFTQLLMGLALAGVLFLVLEVSGWQLAAGSFAAIMAAMLSILRPVRRLTTINSNIQRGIAGAESVFAVLDEADELDQGTKAIDRAIGHIVYQDVTFAYDAGREPVLKHIDLVVEPGQTVALVGHSGGGKSTLVNLLPRFYNIEQGCISIDGVDIRELRLDDLRRQFSWVSQETVLFDDTIANNIAYGIEASEADIMAAAKAAYAWEFIERLPDGLQSMIGQDGVLLSGGQRQRIAIARAMLKGAPILILDEATSALDTHAERYVQQALAALMRRCTSIVIAHRLSTIEKADWIIVLSEGKIIEQGKHADLLATSGAYAELYHMQFREEEVVS